MLSDAETQGGAAIAASRLAVSLREAGLKVTRIVNQPDGHTHEWETVPLRPSRPVRALRRVLPGGAWERVRTTLSESRLRRLFAQLRPDVINVHNLHGGAWAGWSPELIRVCAEHAPVAWTLHDMWSFTGRCAYSYDSRKFITGCDATCANPHEYPALAPERIAGAWEQRRQLFAELPNLVAITPSRWLVEQARAGLWAGHQVEVISNGLSLETYRPHDRAAAREALGIWAAGPCILIAAHGLDDHRKGVALLLEALPQLHHRPLTLLTMGGGETPFQAEGVHHHALGYLSDEQAKVLAYSAADLLVHPALADNQPLVVMEAIACGTPVVAFPIGGLPEMVRPGETGWLAAEVSPSALADALSVALRDLASGANLRSRCRSFAEQEYRVEQQAQCYLALFESLMEPRQIAVRQESR